MCLFPKLMRNPKYKATKKNGGIIPPISDNRVTYVPIGCGNCIECTKQKQTQWKTRLLEDIKSNKTGKFITLTFSNQQLTYIIEGKDTDGKIISPPLKTEGYILDNQIATIAVRRFLERWRKRFKKSVRHWLITELGHNGTEHLHLHGILWTNETPETIKELWKYGYIWPRKSYTKNKPWEGNFVSERTVNYIGKYITKKDLQHKTYKPVILCSKGIGANYIESHNCKNNKYIPGETNETYTTKTGNKLGLPIYWRNKIYTDDEREKLWLEKLDKEVRWVMGEKIDISKGDEEYNKRRKYYQEKNKRLGYGNDEKDWDREKYEREARILKQKERMNNNNNK